SGLGLGAKVAPGGGRAVAFDSVDAVAAFVGVAGVAVVPEEDVIAVAALEDVIAFEADHPVVAEAAFEQVVPRPAGQQVFAFAAIDRRVVIGRRRDRGCIDRLVAPARLADAFGAAGPSVHAAISP